MRLTGPGHLFATEGCVVPHWHRATLTPDGDRVVLLLEDARDPTAPRQRRIVLAPGDLEALVADVRATLPPTTAPAPPPAGTAAPYGSVHLDLDEGPIHRGDDYEDSLRVVAAVRALLGRIEARHR